MLRSTHLGVMQQVQGSEVLMAPRRHALLACLPPLCLLHCLHHALQLVLLLLLAALSALQCEAGADKSNMVQYEHTWCVAHHRYMCAWYPATRCASAGNYGRIQTCMVNTTETVPCNTEQVLQSRASTGFLETERNRSTTLSSHR
eukprot:scaffold188963_cov22-Tisochrysis_lutea.AAC.2